MMDAEQRDRRREVATTLGLEPEPGSRPGRRRLLWLGVAIVVIAAVWLVLRREQGAQVDYVEQEAVRGPLRVVVTATGTLRPTDEVEVGSEVSGEIEQILVDFNDPVSRGQVIALLDTDQLEARLASMQASLAVAEASLTQARATVEEAEARAARSADLADRRLASQQTLEADIAAAKRAVAAVASAEAQVKSARAAVQESETALRKAVIRSPIDGVVLAREIDAGQTLAAAFQTPVLFKLASDLKTMELHLDVDESDIGQVVSGQHAKFRVDAFPGREFDAEITAVHFDPRTVNNIVTYEAILAVANPELLLRPGMTATADIVVAEKHDALLVPNRALRFLPPDDAATNASTNADVGGSKVWVLRDGDLVSIPVQAGLANDEVTEIESGDVAAGTKVVVDIERPRREQNSGNPFQ